MSTLYEAIKELRESKENPYGRMLVVSAGDDGVTLSYLYRQLRADHYAKKKDKFDWWVRGLDIWRTTPARKDDEEFAYEDIHERWYEGRAPTEQDIKDHKTRSRYRVGFARI